MLNQFTRLEVAFLFYSNCFPEPVFIGSINKGSRSITMSIWVLIAGTWDVLFCLLLIDRCCWPPIIPIMESLYARHTPLIALLHIITHAQTHTHTHTHTHKHIINFNLLVFFCLPISVIKILTTHPGGNYGSRRTANKKKGSNKRRGSLRCSRHRLLEALQIGY